MAGSATRRKPKTPAGAHKRREKDGPAGPNGAPTFTVVGISVVVIVVLGWLAFAPTSPLASGETSASIRQSRSTDSNQDATSTDPDRPFDPNRVDENPDMAPDPIEILRENAIFILSPLTAASLTLTRFNVSLINEDPPVYQFEDFLTNEEADALIKLARGRFARSTTGLNRDKTDLSRTSSTAWLIEPEHYSNKVIRTIENRMAAAMNVPATNQEGFQVLEYRLKEYYREHHDFLPEMRDWPCGVRLATFFLYLSDVEEGGGTWFPQLNITGVPKKRRALLWYNVKKHSSGKWIMDTRTQHEAVPVIRGTKYAANKWVHVKDWVGPWRAGKTG